MVLSLKSKINSGYIIAFLLLLLSFFLIFYTTGKVIRETHSVSHTYTVINTLETLKGNIFESESSIRGFVVTKDKRFLQPYEENINLIPVSIEELKKLTADNHEQRLSLILLDDLVRRKMNFMSKGLNLFRKSGMLITEEMKADRETSKRVTDSIRTVILKIKENEEVQVRKRQSKLSQFFTGSNISTIASLIIAILAILFSWKTYQIENRGKMQADKKATQYRNDLEYNIQQLKQAVNELEELRSIEKFAATGRIARTIAHEVRNPLTNITLATDQLQKMGATLPDSNMLLEMIGRNANRINQLVSDLLNATRLGQLEFAIMDLNNLVNETLDLAKDRIELHHVKVVKEFSSLPCHVSVDAEKIKLALLNIIVNGIEAMENQEGVLTLITRKTGDKCIVEIVDNGKGMDKDTLQKSFEPFFTAKSSGNGLGLTNTQNIILSHKGTLKVDSKPGQGTRFTVILNLSKSAL